MSCIYSCCDNSFSYCHLVVPEKAEVPKGEAEKKIWAGINDFFMTEESDDSEAEGFRQHHLQWRSTSESL